MKIEINHYQFRWFALSSLIILADQISKTIIERSFTLYESVSIMPFFNFMLAHNNGAAFSFLSDASGWQRWLFTLIAATVSTVIALWILKLPKENRCESASLALILAGAIGNLSDRIIYGYVIDFIDWFYPSQDSCLPLFYTLNDGACHWPAFNIADSSISIGATLFIVSSLFNKDVNRSSSV